MMEYVDDGWDKLSEQDKAFWKPIHDHAERARKDREFLFALWKKAIEAKPQYSSNHYGFIRVVILDIEKHIDENP